MTNTLKGIITSVIGAAAVLAASVVAAPAALAQVPPEPGGPVTGPVVSAASSVSLLSWQTAVVAVVAVAVGAIIAVVAGRLVHHGSHAPAVSS